MKRLIGFVALVGVMLAGAIYAQDSGLVAGAPGIGDSLYPESGNGGYDVQSYTLDLRWDDETGGLRGIATIQATAVQDLSSFNLDFVGFDIPSIAVNRTDAFFERDDGELTVFVPEGESLREGTPFTVQVYYNGVPVGVDGGNRLGGWNQVGDTVFVASQPVGARTWFPANDHPTDKATFNFRVTVPKPFVVAANGVPLDPVDNGNTTTYIFEANDPMAPYLATVNISDFRVTEQESASGLRFVNYFPESYTEQQAADFELQVEMIETFSDYFGPYPFEISGAVVVDIPLGFALETQTRPLYGTNTAFEGIIAHELVHQWFGNSLALEDWRDIWLNEGFATYGEALWVESQSGPEAVDEIIRSWYISMSSNALLILPKEDFVEQASAALPDTPLTRMQVALLLPVLLGENTDRAQIDAAVAAVPDDGIAANELGALVADIDFDRIVFTPERYLTFFRTLGVEDLPTRAEIERTLVPPGSPTPERLFNRAVYERGALTLHALRLRLGDDTFFEIIQTYYADHAGGNVSTDDFIAVAEDISGEDLATFFDGWLYDQQIPDIPELELFSADFQYD